MATSTTSQSALLSGAAKDDALGADGTFTFTVEQLLANDAGAAKVSSFFFGSATDQATQDAYMLAHGITDNGDGTYTLTSDAIDFQYMVQIGNKGTWSLADVDVTAPEAPPEVTPSLSGIELLNNWNFEQDDANNANGYVDVATVAGWTNEGGTSPMQVQHESFGFLTGFAAGEDQWLDTAASPGNIHIGQDVDVSTGAQARLSVSVAAEDILFSGNTYRPDADDHLLFKFNNVVVKDISLSDFTTNGVVDWNQFRDFTVDVTGIEGMDHLSIETTGMDQLVDAGGFINGAAGFAVDHVSLQEWIF